MKLKLTCLALACIISINAAALEIHKGQLISHSEGMMPHGGDQLFKHRLPVSKFQSLMTGVQSYAYAHAFSDVGITTGKVGIPVIIYANYQVNLYNTTNDLKDFAYDFILCLRTNEHSCVRYADVIRLDAKGNFHNEYQSKFTATVNTPGIYEVEAFTSLGTHDAYLSTHSLSYGLLIIS